MTLPFQMRIAITRIKCTLTMEDRHFNHRGKPTEVTYSQSKLVHQNDLMTLKSSLKVTFRIYLNISMKLHSIRLFKMIPWSVFNLIKLDTYILTHTLINRPKIQISWAIPEIYQYLDLLCSQLQLKIACEMANAQVPLNTIRAQCPTIK